MNDMYKEMNDMYKEMNDMYKLRNWCEVKVNNRLIELKDDIITYYNGNGIYLLLSYDRLMPIGIELYPLLPKQSFKIFEWRIPELNLPSILYINENIDIILEKGDKIKRNKKGRVYTKLTDDITAVIYDCEIIYYK